MVCRESGLSSTMVTFARDMSGLEDNQVLALSHALMREHAAAEATPFNSDTATRRDALVREIASNYESGRLTLAPGSRNPSRRLARALGEPAEERRLYAARRILQRSMRAAAAQKTYLHNYSRSIGATETAASWEYWNRFQEASENPNLQASPAFRREWLSNPDHTDLPVDRRSMYAFEQMEIARASSAIWAETRPAVTRHPVQSSFIQAIGYDPQSGRCEIEMGGGRVYAYRLSQEDWDAFESAPSLGAHYNRHIKNSEEHHYASEEEAAEAAVHRRCGSCGRFVSIASHDCPVIGSTEDLNRQIREAVERARAEAGGTANPTHARVQPHRLPAERTRSYYPEGEGGLTLRTRSVSRLRQDARANALVSVPVAASITDDSGTHLVSGRAEVEYRGRGAGFEVRPVTEPGDSREDNLRCTCDEYRARYHCPHVDAAVGRLGGLVNGDTPLRREQVAAAGEEVLSSVSAESAAAATQVAAVQAAYSPRPVSYVDDFEAFQADYDDVSGQVKAYRAAIRDGADPASLDYPVPFRPQTGALGGLCSRQSGRGFGVEMEYSYPPEFTAAQIRAANRAIGAELHQMGLTRSPEMQPYGEGKFRDATTEHQGGWRFEQDWSTGDYPDGQQGGELISPIMFDEEESWATMNKVLEVAKRHGAIPSRSAGLHVHVGAAEYDHEVGHYNRILQAYAQNEDLLYRIGTNPERRTHRANGYSTGNTVPSSPYQDAYSARSENAWHSAALNLSNMSGGAGDNPEFRMFDSSLNPGVIQTQVMAAAAITDYAGRETGYPRRLTEESPVGSHLRQNPQRGALTGEQWKAQSLSVRKFVDKFLPGGGEDGGQGAAKQFLSLFAMTRWQG